MNTFYTTFLLFIKHYCQEQLKTIQQSGKNTFFLWSLHYVINCSTGVSWEMARKTNIFQLREKIKVQHILQNQVVQVSTFKAMFHRLLP